MSYSAHALMENRNGLIVDFRVEEANGFDERRTALAMLEDHVVKERTITVAGDAGHDTADFVRDCRAINVTPHIAQTRDTRRRSAIDDRTTRHTGYLVSQRKRKLSEIFGWMKTIGGFSPPSLQGPAAPGKLRDDRRSGLQHAAHLSAARQPSVRTDDTAGPRRPTATPPPSRARCDCSAIRRFSAAC